MTLGAPVAGRSERPQCSSALSTTAVIRIDLAEAAVVTEQAIETIAAIAEPVSDPAVTGAALSSYVLILKCLLTNLLIEIRRIRALLVNADTAPLDLFSSFGRGVGGEGPEDHILLKGIKLWIRVVELRPRVRRVSLR